MEGWRPSERSRERRSSVAISAAREPDRWRAAWRALGLCGGGGKPADLRSVHHDHYCVTALLKVAQTKERRCTGSRMWAFARGQNPASQRYITGL